MRMGSEEGSVMASEGDAAPSSGRAQMSAPRAGAARAELTLRDGARVAIEVLDHDDADRLANRGLAAATTEIERALGHREEPVSHHPKIVGRSAPMLALFRMLERIRNSDATVLVLGENGTGKELVARSIHDQSRRGNKPFVATNCSAFNDNLLESELFGHKRGAFTGAVNDKPGLFEVANGGTFFMDEVGDMSPGMQVKLLRVLQEGVFMPVGGTEPKHVDVRIIAATNRDLASMVRQGTFREDLYYRLHVVSVRVPPLRERRDDVPVLVSHFLGKLGKRDKREKLLTPRTLERLVAHEWPGNVRELENEMERLWVLSGDDRVIDEDLLSPAIGKRRAPIAPQPAAEPTAPIATSAEPVTAGPPPSLPDAVETLERRMITEELRRARGNKTKAAEALGISRRNLIRKVQAYGLEDAGKSRPGPRP
ncbi:sigma-54 interaction domain-containing protein [Sandaracinus amylolyticus]|uniref:sigma-54 interaction domain-containing protein n=1 Tax=Sandaracinus amylolyticus TaxID=927083 RepID=UPI001EFF6979|nr:sigma 54-interacting transcriptional regulator [Sandaracinus amylolyticus]UJR82023.1 Hydrogenase Transcriptional regulatory protein HoxA [Sandaracinus amylolyticus]